MKRFWREVSVERTAEGWQVALDGRPVRTQGGAAQAVPSRALAEALAAEWRAQGETVDPRTFPLRDLADYAIDRVAPDRAATVTELLRFAETDTLSYRADPEDPLWHRQQEVWGAAADGAGGSRGRHPATRQRRDPPPARPGGAGGPARDARTPRPLHPRRAANHGLAHRLADRRARRFGKGR